MTYHREGFDESCQDCPHNRKDQTRCYHGARYDTCPWFIANKPFGVRLSKRFKKKRDVNGNK